MSKFEAIIDVNTVEFLLDFPTEFSLKDAKFFEGNLILTVETNLDVPNKATLQYQTDEFGNTGLVGLNG